MNRFYFFFFMFFFFFTDAESNLSTDTVLEQIDLNEDQVYIERLKDLNQHSEMDLSYHTSILPFIKQYTEHDKRLISKMLTLGKYYFNIFEPILDKYNLPLELKYLAVVESSLNPKARSGSGATGLWQLCI